MSDIRDLQEEMSIRTFWVVSVAEPSNKIEFTGSIFARREDALSCMAEASQTHVDEVWLLYQARPSMLSKTATILVNVHQDAEDEKEAK